jgi:hypothetical protein
MIGLEGQRMNELNENCVKALLTTDRKEEDAEKNKRIGHNS